MKHDIAGRLTDSPRISVVTAVFNRVATIGEAMQSVQGQTYSNVQHVVQDGGSSDGTYDVVKRLATERSEIVSERDNGIWHGANPDKEILKLCALLPNVQRRGGPLS